MDIQQLYKLYQQHPCITTDSRDCPEGSIFLALKGETFDGNKFALQALEKGCAYAIVDDKDLITSELSSKIIVVDDCLQTFKDLAREHRRQFDIPVIGITGTNGKTTTKELIREVLAKKYRVTATEGNFNNDVGVPLSLLRITPETEIAVIEMGANHPDDIAKLVCVSQPDAGLITNVGKAHLLGFGSLEGVMAAKGQLYDWLSAHDGVAFVNVDDERLVSMARARSLSILPYGLAYAGAKLLPLTGEHPFVGIALPDGTEVRTRLVGSYNAANVMAALAVGAHFEVPLEDAVAAIEAYEPSNNRSQLVHTPSGNHVIVDAYNANPSSMAAALDNFDAVESGSKAVLLGSMGELGDESAAEHEKLVRRLLGTPGLGCICLVGEAFAAALEAVRAAEPAVPAELSSCHSERSEGILLFPDSAALAAHLTTHPLPKGSTILLKGSRSQKMEVVLPAL